MEATAEFTIEPFVEGAPGPHVQAGIDAARAAGVDVEVGPFGTTVSGALDVVVAAVAAVCRSSAEAGAERVTLQLTVTGG